MTPGPTLVLKCLSCSTLVAHRTTASGNTFGATFYTDGHRVAPMMPASSYLVRCPGCQAVQRLKDLEKVDSYSSDLAFLPGSKMDAELKEAKQLAAAKQDKYKNLPSYQRAEAKDYFDFASSRANDKKEELHLRVLGWRIGNETRRKTGTAMDFDMLEVDNLRRLLHLTEGNADFPQILVAEMYRELGLFHEAHAVLTQLSDPNNTISEFERESLPFYLSLIKNKDARVQELTTD